MSVARNVRALAAFTSRLSALSTQSLHSTRAHAYLAQCLMQCHYRLLAHNNPMQQRFIHSSEHVSTKLPASALQMKKRSVRKKMNKQKTPEGHFNVYAYATAEEYDLESLHTALTKQDLYQTKKFFSKGTPDSGDVLYVCAKYQVETEPHEVFFFREGSVVLWNCSEEEIGNLLIDLKEYEINSYDNEVVIDENEMMLYKYTDGQQAQLKNGDFHVQKGEDGDLDRYTFSNAMTASVKLGIWESTLDRYVNSMAFVTEDLRSGRQIKMSRAAVLRKTGELFALKHLLNLRSDLLDTPDFYWDREKLERLFNQTSSYFSIHRRTKVRMFLIDRFIYAII